MAKFGNYVLNRCCVYYRDDNFIFNGTFDDFESPSFAISAATRINGLRPDASTVGRYIFPDQPLKDASLSPGRFEGGGVRLGANKVPIVEPIDVTALVISPPKPYLIRNNDDQVEFSQTMDLSLGDTLLGVLRKTGIPDFQFRIKEISKNLTSPTEFDVELKTADSSVLMYENSNVSIGGGPFSVDNKIHIINSNTFEIRATNAGKTNLKIPVEVRDDDSISLNSTSTIIKQISMAIIDTTYENIYINVVNDGGGNLANNNANLEFTKNLGSKVDNEPGGPDIFGGPLNYTDYRDDENIFQTKKYANNNYWICQILGSWEGPTYEDRDHVREPGARGVCYAITTDSFLSKGGSQVIIFHEPTRETEGIKCNTLGETGAHELGHCLGLGHGDDETGNVLSTVFMVPSLSDMGIMTANKYRSCATGNNFIPYHQNIIRLRVKSPGVR